EFTGATLGMNNNELLIMGYVCQFIGYAQAPFNAWLTDNLNSKHGKYRVYIRNAHALKRSKKLADKHYADGRVMFDISVLDEAYNLPDETPEQKKIRRKAMKKANKEQNLYAKTAAPYLAALRTVQLAYGYSNLAEIVSDYDNTVSTINSQRLESKAEAERLARERMLDIESKRAQRKIKKH
ncbi:MAG: hypothetical protein IJE93_08330, partial [Clostridia bacterium]|nr:hypothetical protein [Clostridia bacterium]